MEAKLEFQRYKENIDKMSKVMKMRRRHPVDEATDFLEYVVHTKGAKHLRHTSRNLTLVQYFSLDVLFVLLAVIFMSNRILRAKAY